MLAFLTRKIVPILPAAPFARPIVTARLLVRHGPTIGELGADGVAAGVADGVIVAVAMDLLNDGFRLHASEIW